MMYFNNRNDTDIDSEFDNKFNFRDFFLKYKLFIIIGFVLILLIIVILMLTSKKKDNIIYFLLLNGEENITLYQGSEYIEPGYQGYDNKGNDLTKEVVISSSVDVNTVGEYAVGYTLHDVTKYRNVNIIEKPIGATYIHLLGDSIIYLQINEEYKEPGYLVTDTIDSNLKDKVKIVNNINSKKAGIYKVTYSVTNSTGVTSSVLRKVIVMNSNTSISLDNYEYTNKEVGINIHIVDNYFDYLLLPNNEKITSKDYTYRVSENGTYKFTIYNKKGIVSEEDVTVNNIDREKPTGNCSVTVTNDGKMVFDIKSSDNSGIAYYLYNSKKYLESNFTVDGSQEKAMVTIYDKALNSYETNCNMNIEKKIIDNTKEVPVKVKVKSCFGGNVLEENMDFTDYIMGVLFGEEHFDAKIIDNYPEYVKAFAILIRTYSLRRGGYSSHPEYVEIKSCSSDQNWCDIYKGCHRYQTQSMFNGCMKGQPDYGAQKCADRVTVASGVNGSKTNSFSYDGGTVTTNAVNPSWHKAASQELIEKYRKVVNETAGMIIKQKDGSISRMGYVACKNYSGTNGKFCGEPETMKELTRLNLTALEMLQRFTTEDIKIEYYSD